MPALFTRDVEPAERLDGRARPSRATWSGSVTSARTNTGLTAGGVDGGHGGAAVRVVAVGDHDRRAAPANSSARGPADARRAAGDERDLALEVAAARDVGSLGAHEVGPSIVTWAPR